MTEDQGLKPERGPERWPPLLRKAAGAKITQCWNSEVVTRNNCEAANRLFDGNGRRIERFLSNDQRESLVPAAAVIPALKAYTRVVAVKKLVVGRRRH